METYGKENMPKKRRALLAEGETQMRILLWGIIMACTTSVLAVERDYRFDGKISREILENYLSRAITMMAALHDEANADENIRMLKNTGAKFVGRAVFRWGGEGALEALLRKAEPLAKKVHRADPDIILQAAIFEIVTEQVNQIPIPKWVFAEFGLKPDRRNFRYEAMLYPDGHRQDHWSRGASVPDMSQLETRMWFVYVAARYINLGVEAIHFGQVAIMDDRDPGHRYWRDMMGRVRRYAALHARRHIVLCDAHVPSGGVVHGGKLMFDFHSFPLRIEEVPDKPHRGVLKMGYLDSIYGRSKGGITPSGWKCEHLPYIVELDNFESTGRGGQNIGGHWIWGWDEISWFAHQTEEYRNEWLRYAWKWVRRHDPNGYLQMPGCRGRYRANTPSKAAPGGFNQEKTIKDIWAHDE